MHAVSKFNEGRKDNITERQFVSANCIYLFICMEHPAKRNITKNLDSAWFLHFVPDKIPWLFPDFSRIFDLFPDTFE